jgi:hypothetical protein
MLQFVESCVACTPPLHNNRHVDAKTNEPWDPRFGNVQQHLVPIPFTFQKGRRARGW